MQRTSNRLDCAQKKLAGYALWLKALREAVKPARFVITGLLAWLDEPALPRLLDQVDQAIECRAFKTELGKESTKKHWFVDSYGPWSVEPKQ
ncbi:MAG: hypothetical protein JWO08_3754 [Verrucomicrobiaceae bacterium]|nr:hypothetical protein [Verrucomicrobiaceae bacterium]